MAFVIVSPCQSVCYSYFLLINLKLEDTPSLLAGWYVTSLFLLRQISPYFPGLPEISSMSSGVAGFADTHLQGWTRLHFFFSSEFLMDILRKSVKYLCFCLAQCPRMSQVLWLIFVIRMYISKCSQNHCNNSMVEVGMDFYTLLAEKKFGRTLVQLGWAEWDAHGLDQRYTPMWCFASSET